MRNFNEIRTMLFTPATRPERFDKAKEIGADGIVIDLEDAVSLENKDKARDIVIRYFESTEASDFIRCIRINNIKSLAGFKDVIALLEHKIRPDAIMLPKLEYPAEVIMLDSLFKASPIPYIGLIETSVGLSKVEAIAVSSPNLKALCFGGADLAADLGASLAWEPMLSARSQLIQAAGISGIATFDVPYLNLKDTDDTGILEETSRIKALGYTGKLAIHPKHIKPILRVFTPSAEEIANATRIMNAYHEAKGNVCEIDGKMIDVPIVRAAGRILSLSKHQKDK